MQIKNSHINIKIITDNDLCVSCGTCSHICPKKNITMHFSHENAKWEPLIKQEEICCDRCNGKDLCLSVCPSYNVDYMKIADSHENKMLGRIRSVYTGHAADENVQFTRSSGGFIYSLCEKLLAQGTIDSVIALTHDSGLEHSPKEVKDLRMLPGSIYHNNNFENALNIIKNKKGRFLLIGLPCHITSINLFLAKKKYKKLSDKIYGKIALVCGYLHDRANVEAFSSYCSFETEEITYRGNGWNLWIRLKNDKNKLEYNTFYPKNLSQAINNRIMFDNFLPQMGCINCVDHLGFTADVVVGDAWLEKYTKNKMRHSLGHNLIISRTDIGESIVQQLNNFKFFPLPKQDIIECQGIHTALAASAEGIKDIYLSGRSFIPHKRRTNNKEDIVKYKFRVKDKIKVNLFKKLLRRKQFTLLKILFFTVELPYFIRFFLTKRVTDGFFLPFDFLMKSDRKKE